MALKAKSFLMMLGVGIFNHNVLASDVAEGISGNGPYAYETAEYKLPAMEDKLVLPGVATELWARVWLPKDGREDLPNYNHPLVIFLHGNHATCGHGSNPRVDDNCAYTNTGMCPSGYQVVPNHMGYEYAAKKLVSWGYAVASVNANRGITCAAGTSADFGLNLARGKLVLRHLELLSQWNKSGVKKKTFALDIENRIDFSHVGLVGHSRGGEGMRAAYNLYFEDPYWYKNIGLVQFKGIFEIGPVDGQTKRVLNAPLTAWNVLLPMCDGDVSDLQGVKVFDRMLGFTSEQPMRTKSVYMVWGTNHNYYNTEWQQNDSKGCNGHTPLWLSSRGIADQQFIGATAMLNFFNKYLHQEKMPASALEFDPYYESMKEISDKTRVDKEFINTAHSSLTAMIEDFSNSDGRWGVAPAASTGMDIRVQTPVFHYYSRKAAIIQWKTASNQQFLEVAWAKPGESRDATFFRTLDFSIARNAAMAKVYDPTDFSIQLLGPNDELSRMVPLSDFHKLIGPVGSAGSSGLRPLMHTVRIDLDAFAGFTLSRLRGMRFIFNKSASGSIALGQVRLSAFVSGEKDLSDYEVRPIDINPANFATLVANLSAPRAAKAAPISAVPASALHLSNAARTLLTSYEGGSKLVRMQKVVRNQTLLGLKSLSDLVMPRLKKDPEFVKLTYTRDDGSYFPAMGQLLNLTIGSKTFHQSGFADDGSLSEVSYVIPKNDYNSLQNGAESSIYYGDFNTSGRRYFAGSFKKKIPVSE